MGPGQRSGVLAADHDRSECRQDCKPDQRAWWHTRVGTRRHAMGGALIPVEGSRRVQAGDLLAPCGLTILKRKESFESARRRSERRFGRAAETDILLSLFI